MRAGLDLRLLRAAVFAAVCATLAAAGHLAAAGPGIALWALAIGWAAVFAVTAPLAGRERRSTPAIAAALAAGQLALHLLYCLGQHATTTSATAATTRSDGNVLAMAVKLLCGEHAARLSGAEAQRIVTASGIDPTAPATHATHAGPGGHAASGTDCLGDAVASLASAPMLLGHLLAAIAAAWLLRRGETALWRAVRLSARWSAEALSFLQTFLRSLLRALRLTRAPHGAPPPPAPVARPPRAGDHSTATAFLLPHAVTRRGPPGPRHQQLILAA
jgi:hypothetical protein